MNCGICASPSGQLSREGAADDGQLIGELDLKLMQKLETRLSGWDCASSSLLDV